MALAGAVSGFSDQRNQAFLRILPVALLRPKAAGFQNQHALCRHAAAGQSNQAFPNVVRQTGMSNVKTQVYGSRNLIHILAARPGCLYKIFVNVLLINRQCVRNRNHDFFLILHILQRLVSRKMPETREIRKILCKFLFL